LKTSTFVSKQPSAVQHTHWPEQPAQSSAEYFDNQYNETLDVFGSGGMDKPVVVFIHGGYWRSLDKSDFSFVAEPFVGAGACVVVTNYGLCPKVSLSQIVMQQVRALVWVHRNIARYGGDANRIRVIGHSAGGHLAAMLLACRWQEVAADLPRHVVSRAMSLSGLFDLGPVRSAPTLQSDLLISPQEVLQCSPALMQLDSATNNAAKRTDVKLWSFCGADESPEFLRQNALIEKRWGSLVVTKREALLGLNHFSIVDSMCTAGHYLNRSALEFLR
jgi:arylformamidase